MQESAQIASAPHLTAAELTSSYQELKPVARRRFDGKLIVLTGNVNGVDDGLHGNGALHMGRVECEVGGQYGYCSVGHPCTIVGTCDGIDAAGTIHFSNCRTLN